MTHWIVGGVSVAIALALLFGAYQLREREPYVGPFSWWRGRYGWLRTFGVGFVGAGLVVAAMFGGAS